ncbi:MAG TPA: hypothetical protein VGC76_16670 [Pyrinomonadaceae bacterium]|jgi:hypothetical protein
MKLAGIMIVILLNAVCSLTPAQQAARAALQQILSYEKTHDNATDTIFNRRNLEIRRKWMTPSLYRLYLIELAREEREAKEHPDEKPYFGDGMDFGPLKELCKVGDRIYSQKFSFSRGRFIGNYAYLRARFFYHPECDGNEPTYYAFIFRKLGKAWLLDNIDYGRNGGTLRRSLRRAGK